VAEVWAGLLVHVDFAGLAPAWPNFELLLNYSCEDWVGHDVLGCSNGAGSWSGGVPCVVGT